MRHLPTSPSHLCATMTEAEMSARIILADLEIKHLELVLRVAKEERRDIHCAHDRVVNSTAPINRLPYDIIVDIFNRSVGHCNRAASIQSLSSTCHHWRNIMIDTPRFWNHIDLDIDLNMGIVFPDKLHTYAERSNRVPLLFSFTAASYSFPGVLETIMPTLEPYLLRCTQLEIEIPQSFARRIFATPLPLLRRVYFRRVRDGLESTDVDLSANLSRNAPLFDHLHLANYHPLPRLADWQPDKITHLSVIDAMALKNSPAMPYLEILSLHHSLSDPHDALDFIDNTPSLRILRLGGDYPFFAPWVLRQFIKIRSQNHNQGQGRPLGSIRSVYVSRVDCTDDDDVRLAKVARYHLEHPAVNKELVIVLNCGLDGSPDNLAPALSKFVAKYLSTGQVSLAFDATDICPHCARW